MLWFVTGYFCGVFMMAYFVLQNPMNTSNVILRFVERVKDFFKS